MRLLNTETKKVETFLLDSPPLYAILSHRWREEEVTLWDLSDPDVFRMKGYDKLSQACDMARRLAFDYLWMDTCCIDKTSSAELSESINSMYRFYKKAGICIAYLDDVNKHGQKGRFRSSVWFLRGWTLQELIAPAEIFFFAKDWKFLGTKTSLATHITAATGIDQSVLLTGNMDEISIAKKMSWAAKRETTRVEDQAYSLLGIFDVNMPTIYGEGRNAFIRLQQEILKQSNDQSIFAWGTHIRCCSYPAKLDDPGNMRFLRDYQVAPSDLLESNIGLFAPEPLCFDEASDVIEVSPDRLESELRVEGLRSEFTVTHSGVRIQLPLQLIDKGRNVYVAYLRCGKADKSSLLAIYLRFIHGDQYSRIQGRHDTPDLLDISLSHLVTSNIYVGDHLYVKAHKPNAFALDLIAVVDCQDMFDFCEREGFEVLDDSVFPYHPKDADQRTLAYTLNAEADLTECTLEHFFILRIDSISTDIIVVTTLDRDLANRNQANCLLVRASAIVRTTDSSGQSIDDLYQRWCNAREDGPASKAVSVELSDGRELALTILCVGEPHWKDDDGPNDGRWKLSMCML